MRINLISRDNDSGLSIDIALLQAFLQSKLHAVRVVDFEADSPPADVNIYVELFNPKHLKTAPRHVGIFNLEWFLPAWEPFLGDMTQLWAKSAKAFEWYHNRGLDQVTYTGFLSRDLYETMGSQRKVIHVAGASQHKGTAAVISAWRDHADLLPPLTLVARDPIEHVPGITQWIGRISDEKLKELMNEHLFHLCPSVIEGWGHYIAEAMSCANIVITTDASPMNEHVLPQMGALITADVTHTRNRLDYNYVGTSQIVEAMREICSHDDRKLHHMGADARAWWWHRQQEFHTIAGRLLEELAS